MKREIKFRAWDTAKNCWLHEAKTPDMGVHIDGELALLGMLYVRNDDSKMPLAEIIKVEWMQFTGIKDMTGKEVYEGDRVTRPGSDRTYTVVFEDAAFRLKNDNGLCVFVFTANEALSFEITGNIFETTEPIKS